MFDTGRELFEGLPFTPRAWQIEALQLVVDAYTHDDPPAYLVRAVMGAGKSVVQAELAARAAEVGRGGIVVVSAPTRDLVSQLARTIGEACERLGVSKHVCEWHADARFLSPIMVTTHASMPQLCDALERNGLSVGVWIADEAHRTNQPRVREFVARMRHAARVGFTATPYCANSRDALELFDREIYAYDAARALGDGVVVPWRISHPSRSGDVDALSLDWITNRLNRLPDEPGIVNASSVADAHAFARTLEGFARVSVEVVTGEMPSAQRERVFRMFRDGAVPVIAHVNVMTEGVDLPNVRWMCLRRKVQSRVRFAQEVGRGLRAAPGKTHCELFDPHDLFGVHSLSLASALGARPPRHSFAAALEHLPASKASCVPDAQLMSPVMQAVRRLRVAIDTFVPTEVRAGSWRSQPASIKQRTLIRDRAREALTKHGLQHLWGQEVGDIILMCGLWAVDGRGMRKGDASDILDVLFNIRRVVDVETALELAQGG